MFTERRANSLTTRRVRQPWPKGRPFKILALDGGGMKGVYAAELLQRCEDAFCNGRSIAAHFDMIAGTSTGGIIALGLGLELPTSDIIQFYKKDGRRIFPQLPQSWVGRKLRFLAGIPSAKLDHEKLEAALRCRFKDQLVGHSVTRLVIPSFMMPKTEIAVIKTDHHSDFKKDHLTPMWQAARATSAAPTYLKGLEDDESGKIFIDGGVWANNPAMVALVDAMTAYDISFDQIQVLSVGTGNAPFELKPTSIFGGMWHWKEVIKAAMFLTTDNATAQVKLLLGPDNCLRLEPKGSAAAIEMDDYDAAITSLPSIAHEDFGKHRAELKEFFSETVLPRERHYTKHPS